MRLRHRAAHAWIVHDVREVREGEALSLIADGTIDPMKVALIEVAPPPVSPVVEDGGESAVVTDYRADQMTIEVAATAPGMLVVSEMYASGWRRLCQRGSAFVCIRRIMCCVVCQSRQERQPLHCATNRVRSKSDSG